MMTLLISGKLPVPESTLRITTSSATLVPPTNDSDPRLKTKASVSTLISPDDNDHQAKSSPDHSAVSLAISPTTHPTASPFATHGPTYDVLGRLVFVPSLPAPSPVKWARFFPGGYNPSLQLPLRGKKMMWSIQAIGGLAIMFYGYDQGVMSGVVNNDQFKSLMGVDSSPITPRDSAAIGGIVAIYYAGSIFGGMLAGYLGDKIGRVKTVMFGCIIATIGGTLQTSAGGMTWMCIARVISGFGTGGLNAIIPVWSSELAEHNGRGAILAFEFFLNIAGLAFAYWLEFGLKYVSGRSQSFIWRFPLAFQLVFLIVLLSLFSFFPESPRWLAKVGREDDARQVLAVIRTEDGDLDDDKVNEEMYSIMEVVDVERKMEDQNGYMAMMFGWGVADSKMHLPRRTWLVIGLQIWQELTGIGVITVYAPTVFQSAGYLPYKADWLSGVNNIFYMLSVLVAVFTLDRVGRRVTLYWGAVIMAISLAFCTLGARYAVMSSGTDTAKWGAVVATFTFIYTSTFGASWLTVPVLGWSIGNGIVTEITPFLFNAIGEWTFLLFCVLNVLGLPYIYFLYPETACRSLEQMDILFAQDSIFVHRQSMSLERLAKVDPEFFHAMETGQAESRATRITDTATEKQA
ncbi:hypothetical protein IAR55_002161 [Kwoniella newhampshirensis]|uniref:Major facilitator superfamily (MFS) profile domain-containing protein n=1 Tax=Kwoniella newhampshirensis TaxID=1651941 RepID=A0AAW0YTR3_9TREE